MKKKSREKKSSRSARFPKRQKSRRANQNLEGLKINFDVLSGTCEMIEHCAKEKKVFERMLNLIGKAVECSHASLFLLDKKKNLTQEVASVGRKVDLIDFVRFDKGHGFSAWVAKEKRPIVLSNLHRKRRGGTAKSFAAIPLILSGEIFGVMTFSHIRAHAFEAEDVEFLSLISVPVALSLERMFYHSELERLQNDLQEDRKHVALLEEKIRRMESIIPTPQLLEGLNEKIRTPLSSIAENAQFLLNSFSTKRKEKTQQSIKSFNHEFKRGLKEIKNEVTQITRTTEKFLKRRTVW
jgi:transcriptional regulator with GAF, ATPase, and Fis domain